MTLAELSRQYQCALEAHRHARHCAAELVSFADFEAIAAEDLADAERELFAAWMRHTVG